MLAPIGRDANVFEPAALGAHSLAAGETCTVTELLAPGFSRQGGQVMEDGDDVVLIRVAGGLDTGVPVQIRVGRRVVLFGTVRNRAMTADGAAMCSIAVTNAVQNHCLPAA